MNSNLLGGRGDATKRAALPSLLLAIEAPEAHARATLPAPLRSPHLGVKMFFAAGTRVDLAVAAAAFRRWLFERALAAGQLVEVVTEHHAGTGPRVMLVGVHADWIVDAKDGRPGLRYARRGHGRYVKSARDVLREVFSSALEAARLLEVDANVRFTTDVFELVIDDPELAPNERETFAEVERELTTFALEIFESPELEATSASEPGATFRVRVFAGKRRSLGELIARLHAIEKRDLRR